MRNNSLAPFRKLAITGFPSCSTASFTTNRGSAKSGKQLSGNPLLFVNLARAFYIRSLKLSYHAAMTRLGPAVGRIENSSESHSRLALPNFGQCRYPYSEATSFAPCHLGQPELVCCRRNVAERWVTAGILRIARNKRTFVQFRCHLSQEE